MYSIRKILRNIFIIITTIEQNWLLGKNFSIYFSYTNLDIYLYWRFRDLINTIELSKQALQYWISFVPWSIYWKETEYNDSFRMAFA